MLQDNKARVVIASDWYVIKQVDISKMSEFNALQAVEECELLKQLGENNFIVGYYDSFMEGTTINIIQEYCHKGDLYNFI